MSDESTAVFRAVGDFSGLINEANSGKDALKGMDDQSKQVGDTSEKSASRATSAWSKLGSGVLKATKWMALGVAAIGTAVLGMAIKGGISRALNIEDAQAKLKGLGHSTASVTKIMDSALKSVKGTAFALDEAASTAAGAVAAGVQKGDALTRYLKTVADTAQIAGTSLGEMGSILNKVQTTGKAQADNLNQLADRGIPIFQYLQKELGVTADELQEMVRRGEIDSKTFQRVLEKNLGGAALRSADTTRGAFKNMQAAMSRFGAQLVGGSLPLVKQLFIEVGVFFDGIGDRVKPFTDKMNQALGSVSIEGWADKALAGIDALIGRDWAGVSADIGRIGSAAQDVAAAMPDFLSVLGLGWKALVLLAENADLVIKLLPFLAAGFVAVKIAQIGANAAAAASPAFRAAELILTRRLIASNIALATSMGGVTAAAAGEAAGMAGASAATGLNTAATSTNTSAQNKGFLARLKAIPSLIGLALGYNVAAGAAGLATGATNLFSLAIRGLGKAIVAIPVIGWIIGIVTLVVGGLILMYEKFEWFRNLVDSVWSGIMGVVSEVVDWFMANVWPPLKEGIDQIIEALQPIKEAFEDAWNSIKQAVGDAIKSVQDAWNSLDPETVQTILTYLKAAWEALKIGFGVAAVVIGTAIKMVVGLIGGAIVGAATFIGFLLKVVAAIVSFFTEYVAPQIRGFAELIGTIVGWIGTAVSNVVGWIGTAISAVISVFSAFASAVGSAISFVAGVFQNILSVAQTVWNGVASVISTVVGAVVGYLQAGAGRLSSIWNAIVSFIQGGVARLSAILNGIGGIISRVIGFFQGLLSGVARKISGVVGVVTGLPGRILSAVSGFGSLLKDAGVKLIQGLIDGITSMIDNVKGAIGSVAETIASFLPRSPVKAGPLVAWNRGAAGRKLMEYLEKGIIAGGEKVRAAVNKVADYIRKTDFAPNRRAAAIRVTNQALGKMNALAESLAKANATMASAQKQFEDLVQARANLIQNAANSITNTGNIASIGASLLERGRGFLNVGRMQKELDKAYSVAQAFSNNLRALAGKGISKDLLGQLVEAGIGTADQVAAMLAKATPAELKALSDRFAQLKSLAGTTATWAGNEVYNAGINAARALADGMASQVKYLEKAAAKMAAAIVSQIKQKLQIKSPSRVMAFLGRMSGEGFQTDFEKAVDPKALANRMASAATMSAGALNSALLSPLSGGAPAQLLDSGGVASTTTTSTQTDNRSKTTQVNVYYPEPEPASDGLARTMRNLDFIGVA